MMLISALTTALAIAAVAIVIGYRLLAAGAGTGNPVDDVVALPKGARVIAMAGSSGRVAVMIEIGADSELRTFDVKTLKQTGRLRFTAEP